MQGYDADNPNIELLRLRNFTIGKKISDEQVTSPSGLDTIVNLIGTMTPFVSCNFPIMPILFMVLHQPALLSSSLSECRFWQTLVVVLHLNTAPSCHPRMISGAIE